MPSMAISPDEPRARQVGRLSAICGRAGLRHGDVILAVDGREVRSYQDMLDRMRDHQPGEEVMT